jgi:hypothetical protein
VEVEQSPRGDECQGGERAEDSEYRADRRCVRWRSQTIASVVEVRRCLVVIFLYGRAVLVRDALGEAGDDTARLPRAHPECRVPTADLAADEWIQAFGTCVMVLGIG